MAMLQIRAEFVLIKSRRQREVCVRSRKDESGTSEMTLMRSSLGNEVKYSRFCVTWESGEFKTSADADVEAEQEGVFSELCFVCSASDPEAEVIAGVSTLKDGEIT